MLPQYDTKLFIDVFPTYSDFQYVFDNEFGKYAKDCISVNNLTALYYLLFARYGANPIVNPSIDIFKARLVATTFQKGPTWERKLAIQKSLRDLTEAELQTGARTLMNRAQHDEGEPGTDTDQELSYINSQDVQKMKRSKLDAYSFLQDVLQTDVTEEFIVAFAPLFSKFVSPNRGRIYENDIEEEDEDNE